MRITYYAPNDSRILVKEGDKVDFDTQLFEKKISKRIEIDIAKELGINPKNIFRYLTKLVGEKINKEDIIAVKKGLFLNGKVKSSVDGIIKEIDHHTGIITIDSFDKKNKHVQSPIKGEVEKITKNQIDFKLTKVQEYPIKKSETDFGGEVLYLDSDSQTDISTCNTENRVVFCEKISSLMQIKAEALGAKGFITLQQLPQDTDAYSVLLKNIEDAKKILKSKFTYCSVIAKSANIYFYS